MTQAICDITTEEVNVDVVVEPQSDTMVEVANRAGGMEQVFHDNTLIGNGNSIDLGVNTDLIATKEYVDEKVESIDTYTKDQIDGKLTAVDAQIDANADAIQKTREDYIQADSEIHQILNNHADELTTLRGNQASLGDQVSGIEEKIPGSASATNPLVTKEDLKDVHVDLTGYATTEYVNAREQEIRDDVNQADSELQSQITAQASAITANTTSINDVKAVIPGGTSDTNPLINKQQLLDEEMDIRDDLNESVSELQSQITAQAAEIATKQDKLIAGDNITIVDNVISATGGGGGVSGDYLPLSGGTLTGPLTVPEFAVSTAEGAFSVSITAGVATIATNNGLDIVSQTKFDKAPTTDDNTTWANALDTSLVSKRQVAAAMPDTSNFATNGQLDDLRTYVELSDQANISALNATASALEEQIAEKQDALGFVPENAANKVNDIADVVDRENQYPTVHYLETMIQEQASQFVDALEQKQDVLTAGENITISNNVISAKGGASLPDQSGNAGKVLTTDGTTASWQDAPASGTKVIIKRY